MPITKKSVLSVFSVAKSFRPYQAALPARIFATENTESTDFMIGP
jgi:hypothetical protein